MILALALIFGVPSLAALFFFAWVDVEARQRKRRAEQIRAELATAEAVRIDSLKVIGARRGPELPSIKRTVS